MFDAMTFLNRKCAGEQWHLLAREAGMPMGQFRATLEAIGKDRLAAAGYRVQGAGPSSRPARHLKHHRRRQMSVTKAPTPANGNPESELHAPVTPELDHGRIPAPPPDIPAFERSGENSSKLTDKYRPRTLSEVLGQPEIVASLQRFVAAPYSCAMLFHGDSGIGKTSAAYAWRMTSAVPSMRLSWAGCSRFRPGRRPPRVCGRFWTCSATGRCAGAAGGC